MTTRGKIVLTLLVLAVVGVGVGQWRYDLASQRAMSRSVWTVCDLSPLLPGHEPGHTLSAAPEASLKTTHSKRFALNPSHALGPGGTANLAVPGGNLPPGWSMPGVCPMPPTFTQAGAGRVARQNGPVARSTLNPTIRADHRIISA